MDKIVNKLIDNNSKFWLAETLGISRVTLDKRIKDNNWKKSEIQMLLFLNK